VWLRTADINTTWCRLAEDGGKLLFPKKSVGEYGAAGNSGTASASPCTAEFPEPDPDPGIPIGLARRDP